MADDIPAARFSLPAFNISQSPFLQSYGGIPSPFANQQDQIQQAMQISGVYPGQMPDNTFLGNTAARYAFGRTLPGSSPYQGALTSYMQGKGMPTGIPLGILGLTGGIGQPPPPNSSGPPYPGGGTPGTYPPPGGGGFGAPPPGGVAPPPFPGGAGGTPPPTGGGLLGGGLGGGQHSVIQGGYNPVTSTAGRQQQLQTQGTQLLQGVTDPATRYMMAMAYHIAPASIGLTNEQINQLEQATMGSTYNKATGQVQRNY